GRTLTIHRDGGQWTHVPSPNPNLTNDINLLADVEAIAANDVWAVGYGLGPGTAYLTLIEHWDGSQWSIVPSPNVSTFDNYLWGVSALSTNDIWAACHYKASIGVGRVDRTIVDQWYGSEWIIVSSHNLST